MRRIRDLYEDIVASENLWRAWREYRRSKRQRPSVARVEISAGRRIASMHRRLADGSWQPGGYRLKIIHEPKRRLIAAATVGDRIVHHAVHRIVAPLLDRGLVDTTYACLPRRGSHRAVLALVAAMRRHQFVLALDIRHYFPSIDRRVLLDLLARRVKDRRLLDLLATIANSGDGLYQVPGLARFLGLEPGFPPPGCGLPIGNLTSQWWGNLYLSGVDHFIKRELRIPHYQRYMDDLTLVCSSRSQLHEAREAIAAWLWRERRLRLKHPTAAARSTGGSIEYLGYRISRAGVRPGAHMLRNVRRRMGNFVLRGNVDDIRRSIASYRGILSFISVNSVDNEDHTK